LSQQQDGEEGSQRKYSKEANGRAKNLFSMATGSLRVDLDSDQHAVDAGGCQEDLHMNFVIIKGRYFLVLVLHLQCTKEYCINKRKDEMVWEVLILQSSW